MKVKLISFMYPKPGIAGYLHNSGVNKIPGLTGFSVEYGDLQKLIPGFELSKRYSILLVKCEDTPLGELYIVLKNRYELPIQGAVVTADFLKFLDTWYTEDEIDEVETSLPRVVLAAGEINKKISYKITNTVI